MEGLAAGPVADEPISQPRSLSTPDSWMEGLAARQVADEPVTQPRPSATPVSWMEGLSVDSPEDEHGAPVFPVSRPLDESAAGAGQERPAPVGSASRTRRARWALGASLGSLALLITLGATFLAQQGNDEGDQPLVDAMSPMLTTPSDAVTTAEPSSAASPAAATEQASASDTPCVESNASGVWSGRRNGGTANGPDVIFGFQHLYYVERDAAKARALATPDAYLAAVDKLQAGIDSVPQGTTYCLRISGTDPDVYRVVLTQFTPDRPADVWVQTVRTRTEGDRTLIASIKGEG